MQDLLTSAMMYGGVSLLSAGVAILAMNRVPAVRDGPRAAAARRVFADTPRRYEFREGYLVSPLDANDAFLPRDIDRSTAFDALSQGLGAFDPDLPRHLAALARRGEAFAVAGSFGADTLSVAGRADADRVIVTIGPTEAGTGRLVIDTPMLNALQTETGELRRALDLGCAAMWKEDATGRILWANGPYLAMVERLSGDAPGTLSWPVPHLFSDQLDPVPEPGSLRRCSLTLADGDAAPTGDTLWFEVSAERHDGATVFCASPIDRLVGAEAALNNFVQTLSKTFAQLPIGLAIFDKRRELMMFNPALVSLSTLPPEFLSRRPRLVAFLDALRDRQRMPEPKNYRTWRDDIARLEQGAEQGTYRELWTLPTGQSFRVIGRPHPDGALAFMFEDITAEVSLTRKFRGDLGLYKSALDDTPGALAVFSGEGQMVLANTDYAALWQVDTSAMIGTLSVTEATRAWQARCAPTGLWGDIRQFAAHKSERATWTAEIAMQDGHRVLVRVSPLTAGAMAVRFAPVEGGGPLVAPTVRLVEPRGVATALNEIAEPAAEFRSRRIAET